MVVPTNVALATRTTAVGADKPASHDSGKKQMANERTLDGLICMLSTIEECFGKYVYAVSGMKESLRLRGR